MTTAGSLAAARPRSDRLSHMRASLTNYVALTRPRVLSGVLLTAPPALALGRGDWPDGLTISGVMVGVALVGAGCGALNAWWELDRDARMARTKDRPLPTGRLAPERALVFGVATSILGLLALVTVGGLLPAMIAAATILHYLFVYTIWLKPRSVWSTVVGGLAGATAPLIADAAVDGVVGPWGLALFAIVFVWQPPHVWAIVLQRRDEYAAAGFPVLPNVAGEAVTRRHMLGWALALLPVTMTPWLGGVLGWRYALAALAGGGFFVARTVAAIRAPSRAADRRVFAASLAFLGAVFGTMLLEAALR